ncbi:LPXTG-motif cell wall-anchored protein [Streptomyces sp. 840.1]|uniref:LPXTG cell wall anchor domain-containing protein n=1 Tax=Streptomyces sp. 840.1 TaxID=2485152 RepID=UPI000F47F6B1|nr:LPXTG cell wall anchor domain-containing protein [Streptomyces sp. 840.1]ROQ66488.1 LPXTG-motif cell wall-anchored protein [Streptomyces sp. 840.1]
MASTRRPLLTATAAGTLLCALWFVPTATATGDTGGGRGTPDRTAAIDAMGATGAQGARLADTGTGTDTAPYLIGGMAFLGIGAGFVTYSARRTGPLPAH